MKRSITIWVLVLIFSLGLSKKTLDWNLLSLKALQGAFRHTLSLNDAENGFQKLSISDCYMNWLPGRIADLLGYQEEERNYWMKLLECSETYIKMLKLVNPEDAWFAEKAYSFYPNDLNALYWYAETREKTAPNESFNTYSRIIQLDQHQGLAWCRLGILYEIRNLFDKAEEALLQCCYNGDPGVNGCYGAGQLMERLGNPMKAIEYYHLSHWQGALKRVEELEKRLLP